MKEALVGAGSLKDSIENNDIVVYEQQQQLVIEGNQADRLNQSSAFDLDILGE